MQNTSSPDPFTPAVAAHHNDILNAGFARQCLRVALTLAVAVLVSGAGNAIEGWFLAHPERLYFATVDGKIVPIQPTSKPAYSTTDVIAFGADNIRNSFNLDFVHYKSQMAAQSASYSDAGFAAYHREMSASKIIETIEKEKMNLSVMVGPGALYKKGLVGDYYTWVIQYPVTVQLFGSSSQTQEQHFIFTQTLSRADVKEKPRGLEITNIVTQPK
jgi:intracellular multiplication protein IcmL